MTPTQLEAAARELCRIRGVDPDAPLRNPWMAYLPPHPRVMWQGCAREIERFAQINAAIASVTKANPN